MKTAVSLLRKGNGIFNRISAIKHFEPTCISSHEDKINMRNDMYRFAKDFRRATDEAKTKYSTTHE